MNIISARYVYEVLDPTKKIAIELTIGQNRVKNIAIDPDRASYQEIMRQVEAGELIIQEADS